MRVAAWTGPAGRRDRLWAGQASTVVTRGASTTGTAARPPCSPECTDSGRTAEARPSAISGSSRAGSRIRGPGPSG